MSAITTRNVRRLARRVEQCCENLGKVAEAEMLRELERRTDNPELAEAAVRFGLLKGWYVRRTGADSSPELHRQTGIKGA